MRPKAFLESSLAPDWPGAAVAPVGVRRGGQPANESDHFYLCARCRQPVDMRDLGAVLHHEDEGHAPLAAVEAVRLYRVRDPARPEPAGAVDEITARLAGGPRDYARGRLN